MALIYTVIIVTLVVVLGPGLALRGKDPAVMEFAVVSIRKERTQIYTAFLLGVVSFLVMSLCCAWILMDLDSSRCESNPLSLQFCTPNKTGVPRIIYISDPPFMLC